MVQAALDAIKFNMILKEDQIKIEPEETTILLCGICRKQEEIDIQSLRNTTPFTCLSCERMGEYSSFPNIIDILCNLNSNTDHAYLLLVVPGNNYNQQN